MATEQDLVNRLKRAPRYLRHAGKRKGETVAIPQVLEDGTTVTDVKDRSRDGYVWVRFDNNVPQSNSDDARAATSVRCFNADDTRPGVFVWVVDDADGEQHIDGLDEASNLDAFGDAAKTLKFPALASELFNLILEGRNFKPNRVRPDASGGLNIFIEPGIYSYADTYYAWDDPTPYDLAAITVSASRKKPVIIGLDPATNAIITAVGSEATLAQPDFTIADYVTVMNGYPGKIWLAGYTRTDGITTFRAPGDLVDIRAWLSPGQGLNAGGAFMPIELDFALTIPANRQERVYRFGVIEGGVFGVDDGGVFGVTA